MFDTFKKMWVPTRNITEYESLDWAITNDILVSDDGTNDLDIHQPVDVLMLCVILLRFADYISNNE